jgi:hypothetical protein
LAFRAPDHRPEIVCIVRASLDLAQDWKLKMTGLGLRIERPIRPLLGHTWNRWYALESMENGEFASKARLNTRINAAPERPSCAGS